MRKIIDLFPVLFVCAAALLMSGCGSSANITELDARLQEIETRPRGRIEPPPEYKPIAIYAYSAHQKRSPFRAPVEQELLAVQDGRMVEPDLSRAQEYLERYSLDALRMVGTINRPGQGLQALIADPAGAVTRVKPGNFVGKNFGRVTEVTDARVSLLEIVPDGRDGWVERSSSISISE